MTIQLERLEVGTAADRNVLTLMRLVLDTGGAGLGFRFGITTLTWPGGSANATNATPAHELGKTPAIVIPFAAGGITGSASYPVPVAFGYGATTFTLGAQTNLGDSPGAGNTASIGWVAIG